jgi:hypothetical protein
MISNQKDYHNGQSIEFYNNKWVFFIDYVALLKVISIVV